MRVVAQKTAEERAGRESPPGGRGAGTGPGGLRRLGQPLWVGSWYGRSWSSLRSASGVGHPKASAPAPEDRGPHSRRDPRSGRPRKQRSTEAQPFRGRVGERSCAQLQRRPRDREGFQINSDPRMACPASAPQGSGRSLCSWWQVSGAGSPAWAAFRKGFREGSAYCGSRGAAPGRGRGADGPRAWG